MRFLSGRPASHRLGFVLHQLVEYALALFLLVAGVHMSGGGRLVAFSGAAGIAVLNLCTAAPLGARALLSRRAHHFADLVLAAGLLVGPIVAFGQVGASGIAVGLLVAACLLLLERSSSYLVAPARPLGASPSATVANLAPVTAVLGRRSARGLGRLTGKAKAVARQQSVTWRSSQTPGPR